MYFKLLIFLLAMIHSSVKIENPFAETLALSKKEGKEILLVFTGSDWCHSCMYFKDQLLSHTGYLNEMTHKYVIHIVDFPRNNKLSKEKIGENESLAEAYNKEGRFPKILIIDHHQSRSQTINYTPGEEKEFLSALDL